MTDFVDSYVTIPGTDRSYLSFVLTTVTFVDEVYFVLVQFLTEFGPEDEPIHTYADWMRSIAQAQADKIEEMGE